MPEGILASLNETHLGRRIAVINDEAIIGLHICELFKTSGFRAIANYRSVGVALEAFGLTAPELVIIDDTISSENGLNGIDGASDIRRRYGVPIIGIGASLGYWVSQGGTPSIDLALLNPFKSIDLIINVALLMSKYYPLRQT